MTLGISTYNSSSTNPSPAAPRDRSGSKLSQAPSGNTRSDETAPRRSAKLAEMAQAEAKAKQIEKEVLDIKGAEEKAKEPARRSIDIYA